jgi:hypothetical protein
MFVISVSNYENLASMVLDWLGIALMANPLLATHFSFWHFPNP